MTPATKSPHRVAAAALIALFLLAACTAVERETEPRAEPPTSTEPGIYFRVPSDGATVGPTFGLEFGLRNYGVAPAGVRLPNTGHFHVLIDVEPPATGEIIPADSLHRHFGGGQIETWLTLAPGRHTLRLVLADADHRMIGPALVSAPISITVQAR